MTSKAFPAMAGLTLMLALPAAAYAQPDETSVAEDVSAEALLQPVEEASATTDISKCIVAGIQNRIYSGSPLTQNSLSVIVDGKTLSKSDYTVSYSNNTRPGKATIRIEGRGAYSGMRTATFEIAKANISKASFNLVSTCAYSGKTLKPKPVITFNGRRLVDGPDYILNYSNNVNTGTAKIVVKSKGPFTNQKTLTFKIVPGPNNTQAIGYEKSVAYSRHEKIVKGAIKATRGYGRITYTKVSGDSAFSVNPSNGNITVRPKTKGGSYKLRIRVNAAGDRNHRAMYVTRNVLIKVKGSDLETTSLEKIANAGSRTNYGIAVNLTQHRAVIARKADGKWKVVKNWICSTGAPGSETPTGLYETQLKTPSFGHGYTCYWATGFIGGTYLFHSGIYEEGTYNLRDGRLGEEVSGGCVRFTLTNAKWLYDHVPLGTRVVISY